MSGAGSSRGLLLLQLLLLAGELVCHGSILQLHARQRVLDVRQVVGLGGLELQCCWGRGLRAQLRTQRRLVLVCHLGIEAVAPLLQQVGLVFLHAATHDLSLDEAVKDHPDHHHGDRPRGEDIINNIIIIITRPWPAFGRQGLVGSSGGYTYHGYTSHASPRACGARLGLQL